MSQVNLLPHDVQQGQRYRRLTLTVLAGGAVVLALIIAFFLLQVGKLGSVNDDVAPDPSLTPFALMLPGSTMIRLLPMLWICS